MSVSDTASLSKRQVLDESHEFSPFEHTSLEKKASSVQQVADKTGSGSDENTEPKQLQGNDDEEVLYPGGFKLFLLASVASPTLAPKLLVEDATTTDCDAGSHCAFRSFSLRWIARSSQLQSPKSQTSSTVLMTSAGTVAVRRAKRPKSNNSRSLVHIADAFIHFQPICSQRRLSSWSSANFTPFTPSNGCSSSPSQFSRSDLSSVAWPRIASLSSSAAPSPVSVLPVFFRARTSLSQHPYP